MQFSTWMNYKIGLKLEVLPKVTNKLDKRGQEVVEYYHAFAGQEGRPQGGRLPCHPIFPSVLNV